MPRKYDRSGEAVPLFCDRCSVELKPGKGNFYLIKIEAIADPTPPDISEADVSGDVRNHIERLLAQMQELSAQEAMDQVYRRLTLYLCNSCYRRWIESPTA